MAVDVKINIDVDGPMFRAGIQRGVIEGINDGIDEIMKIGEGDVKKQLYVGHGFRTGNLREAVAGDVISDLHGVIDAGAHVEGRNVVYAEWIEGIAARNRSTRFKGYRMFRNTTAKLNAMPLGEIIVGKIVGFLR